MSVITISRQYGSGGSDIARYLADILDWELIDNEFIDLVAERSQLSREEVERREESVSSLIDRVAKALAFATADLYSTGGGMTSTMLEPENIAKVTELVIEEAVKEGDVVMVGRGAQAYLANREDTIHVLVVAKREERIRVSMDRLETSQKQAADKVDQIDGARREYVKTNYGRRWDDPAGYDLCINTTDISHQDAAEIVLAAARLRGWTAGS